MTDALRDAELLADAVLEVLAGAVPEAIALRGVPGDPGPALPAAVRGHRAGRGLRLGLRPRVQALLRAVSSAMSDEVEPLQALPTVARRPGVALSSRLTRGSHGGSVDAVRRGRARRERRTADCSGASTVTVDGVPWRRPTRGRDGRRPSLVKVLALAPGRRLHREQVIDALWPDLPADAAVPRLHKAAHYARRALGDDAAASLLLRNDMVALLPDARRARRRRRVPQPRRGGAGRRGRWTGPPARACWTVRRRLLPDDLYEPWAEEPRDGLRMLRLDLLRLTGRWDAVLEEDAADEQAHLALVRGHADRGDDAGGAAAARAARPGPARASWAPPRARRPHELRAPCCGAVDGRSSRASARRGTAGRPPRRRRPGPRPASTGPTRAAAAPCSCTGPPGVGKSAVLELADGPGPAARLADRARHGLRRRGAVAVRAGPRGAGRPLPPAPRPAGRAGRQLPRRGRAGPVGPGRRLERRDGSPAAVPGGRRAAAAGRRRSRARCSWWTTSTRRTRRRCGCCTTSPGARSAERVLLLLAHRPDTDAAMREVAGQPGGPRCRRRARAAAAGPVGHPPARRPAVPLAGRGDAPADLCRQRRPAVHRARDGPRRRERAAADGRLRAAPARSSGRSSGSRCSARRSPPTSCWPSRAFAEDGAYRHLDTALGALVVEPAGRGIPVPARPGP